MHPKVYSHVTRGSLHSAVQKGSIHAVKILLSRGLCVDVQDSLGRTLLHYATSNSDEKMVKLLLKYKAKVDIVDFRGFTPIHVAVDERYLNILKLLVNSRGHKKRVKYLNLRNYTNNATLLHGAAINGDLKLIKYIINNGGKVDVQRNDNKFTPLHYAILRGDPKCVRELLKHIDDINDMEKYKILLACASRGNYFISSRERILSENHPVKNLSKNIKELQYVEIIDILLNAGVKFNESDFKSMRQAIITKNFLIAERLTEECVKFDVDYISRTPDLFHLAIAYKAPVNFIKKLLNFGALASGKDSKGRLPIHVMALTENYKVLSLLIHAGADINGKTDDGETIIDYLLNYKPKNVLSLYMLLMYGVNIHARTADGRTGLHTLCWRCFNYSEYLGILLDWFLDFNVVNEIGQTPLQFALIFGLTVKHIQCIIKAMVKMESGHTSFKISKRNMDTIISNGCLKFYQACVTELENLKLTKVFGHISFFELIDKPLEKLKAYTRNCELMEILNSGVCDSFPIYAELIESRMCIANRLRNLHEQSLKTLYKLINPIQIPEIPANKILSFLHIDELEKMSSM